MKRTECFARECARRIENTWTGSLIAIGLLSGSTVGGAGEADSPIHTAIPSTTLSGYVDVSAIWRIGENASSSPTASFPNTLRSPGRLYDVPEKQNGFNLNAVSLTLDNPLDDSRWSSGYHVQMLFGPDARLRNIYSLSGGPSDIGVNEAYVTLRTPPGNGLDFRIGYFTSPLGYEVYDSCRNANYSRSYGYYIEPKAHTGATMKYDFTEWCRVLAGLGNSYSPFIDAKPDSEWALTYLAVMTLTGAAIGHPDLLLNLGYTTGHTATGAPTDTDPRIHNFYAGAKIPLPVQGLALGLAYDYQANYAAGLPARFFFPPGPKSTYANATALYLNYTVAKWRFNTRADYATGTAGNTILGNYDPFGSNKPMFGSVDDEFVAVTQTVDYTLWNNVLSRLEFRWDHDLAGGVPAFGSAAHPRSNSYTLALNLVYLF